MATKTTKHRPRPLTKASFAREVGKSRSAITQAARPGGPLYPAVMSDGRVDAAHPAAEVYAINRIGESAPEDSGQLETPGQPIPPGSGDVPTKADFARLTYRKRAAEAKRAESRNERDAGRLVSREAVHTHLTAYVDALQRRLLTDAARTVAAQLLPLAKADASLATCEEIARGIVAKHLKALKARTVRAMQGDALTTGDAPPALSANRKPAERSASELRRFALMVRTELTTRTAGNLFDAVSKTIGRAAVGQPWNAAVFDGAMHTSAEVEAEAVQMISAMLAATIDGLLSASVGPTDDSQESTP